MSVIINDKLDVLDTVDYLKTKDWKLKLFDEKEFFVMMHDDISIKKIIKKKVKP